MRRLRSWTRPRQERGPPACCNLQPAPHSRRACTRCLRSVQCQQLLMPKQHPACPLPNAEQPTASEFALHIWLVLQRTDVSVLLSMETCAYR